MRRPSSGVARTGRRMRWSTVADLRAAPTRENHETHVNFLMIF